MAQTGNPSDDDNNWLPIAVPPSLTQVRAVSPGNATAGMRQRVTPPATSDSVWTRPNWADDHPRIAALDHAARDWRTRNGATNELSDEILDGFRNQGIDLADKIATIRQQWESVRDVADELRTVEENLASAERRISALKSLPEDFHVTSFTHNGEIADNPQTFQAALRKLWELQAEAAAALKHTGKIPQEILDQDREARRVLLLAASEEDLKAYNDVEAIARGVELQKALQSGDKSLADLLPDFDSMPADYDGLAKTYIESSVDVAKGRYQFPRGLVADTQKELDTLEEVKAAADKSKQEVDAIIKGLSAQEKTLRQAANQRSTQAANQSVSAVPDPTGQATNPSPPTQNSDATDNRSVIRRLFSREGRAEMRLQWAELRRDRLKRRIEKQKEVVQKLEQKPEAERSSFDRAEIGAANERIRRMRSVLSTLHERRITKRTAALMEIRERRSLQSENWFRRSYERLLNWATGANRKRTTPASEPSANTTEPGSHATFREPGAAQGPGSGSPVGQNPAGSGQSGPGVAQGSAQDPSTSRGPRVAQGPSTSQDPGQSIGGI